MNWRRIWTGTLAAGAVIFCLNLLTLHFGFGGLETPQISFAFLQVFMMVFDALLLGFFCSCLYAVARPRLGPGPKTAVIVGSTIYLIKFGLTSIVLLPRLFQGGVGVLFMMLLPWMEYVAATYLAGWQYIEKAP